MTNKEFFNQVSGWVDYKRRLEEETKKMYELKHIFGSEEYLKKEKEVNSLGLIVDALESVIIEEVDRVNTILREHPEMG